MKPSDPHLQISMPQLKKETKLKKEKIETQEHLTLRVVLKRADLGAESQEETKR